MKLSEETKQELKDASDKLIKYLLMFLLYGSILFFLIAPPILLMFYTDGILCGIGGVLIFVELITLIGVMIFNDDDKYW